MKATARTTLLLALCLPAAGCGDGEAASTPDTVDAGTVDGGGEDVVPAEAAPEAGEDAGAPDATEADVACSDTDTPDLQGEDANCDGADGTVGVDVYLDPNAGDDSNTGSPDHPVKTLERAIALASSRQGAVLVAAGVFAADALSLDSNIRIFGGYDATFLGARQRQRTTFETGAAGWSITSSGSVELHSMTVHGADAQATATEHAASTYALVLDVTEAVLEDVDLQAGDADSGKTGKDGPAGQSGIDATGSSGATGLTCFFSPQQQFTRGADAGKPNAYSQPAGILVPATPPPTGQAGHVGTAGTNASGEPSLDGDELFFGAATIGQGDGTPGYGGPGGGGGTSTVNAPCVYVGGKAYSVVGGGGGTGGCPGWGGWPGTSGGGAVALLVRGGTVAIRGSRLATGFAGAGGDGGAGGVGGDGGKGARPEIDQSSGCYNSFTPVTMSSTCTPDNSPFKCAAYGAAGGKGGDGGVGGGGAGGWTIGVVTVGEATAEVDSATQLSLGKPGTGGTGGLARAPDGQKAPSHHIAL